VRCIKRSLRGGMHLTARFHNSNSKENCLRNEIYSKQKEQKSQCGLIDTCKEQSKEQIAKETKIKNTNKAQIKDQTFDQKNNEKGI
jgi:hypothetical protein